MDKNNNKAVWDKLIWDTRWDDETLFYPREKICFYTRDEGQSFKYTPGTLGCVMYDHNPTDKFTLSELENTSLSHHLLTINTMIQRDAFRSIQRDGDAFESIDGVTLWEPFLQFLHLAKIEEILKEIYFLELAQIEEKHLVRFPCYTKMRNKCFLHCNTISFTAEDLYTVHTISKDLNLCPKLNNGVQKLFYHFVNYEVLLDSF